MAAQARFVYRAIAQTAAPSTVQDIVERVIAKGMGTVQSHERVVRYYLPMLVEKKLIRRIDYKE